MKELIHPEDVGMVYQSIEESFKTRQPWRAEFRVCNPVRGEIWVEGHSTPEPDSDGSMLWHGFLSNITERKMLETKMAGLNKELIEISRQAGMAEVATGVLHNVGNVLNSVNISATLVADTLKKTKAANLSKVVTLLDQNAATIGEFMNSFRVTCNSWWINSRSNSKRASANSICCERTSNISKILWRCSRTTRKSAAFLKRWIQ